MSVPRPSDRSFGFVMALVLTVVALAPWFSKQGTIRPRVLLSAAGVALLAIAAPVVLRPFALVWFRIGLLLQRITSPLVLAIIYFLVITPTALIQRLRGRDLLRLRSDPLASTYWLARAPEDCAGRPMERQF